MSSNTDLSFLRKRDADDVDIPPGAVAGMVLGIIAIVAVSIWCCCPCWKKGGARPRPLRPEEEAHSNYGGEKGMNSEIPLQQVKSTGSAPSDQSTRVSALSTATRSQASAHGYNTGISEVDTVAPVASELDGTPAVREIGGQELSPPPRYEQIQRRPIAGELPTMPPASFQSPGKV